MQTIGKHYHGPPDYIATCDVCGVPWPRRKLVRGRDGRLRCPPDNRGKTVYDLDMENGEIRPPVDRPKERT